MKHAIEETIETTIDKGNSTLTFWMGGFRGPGYDIDSDGVKITYDETKVGTTAPISEEITPTTKAWDRFWNRVDTLDIWSWDSEYSNPEVRDGTLWTLELAHNGRSLITRGDNAYPAPRHDDGPNTPSPAFAALLAALSQLCGGREIL